MSRELWTAVDRYIEDALLEPLPAVGDGAEVSSPQGALLELLARACGARRVVELGTLAGYSTTWLAR
jgi:predicted O-methyltransferase YrrM